jgi:hypothetical protein
MPTEAAEEQEEAAVVEETQAPEVSPDSQEAPGCSLLPVGLIAIPALLARRRKTRAIKGS